MLEKVILFLLSTTKILLKKSSSSAGDYFSLSFLESVLEREKVGFEQRRWISAFMSWPKWKKRYL